MFFPPLNAFIPSVRHAPLPAILCRTDFSRPCKARLRRFSGTAKRDLDTLKPGFSNGGSKMATENKMKPTNPNAHTYVNGTDVKTHGYAVTHNTFLQ